MRILYEIEVVSQQVISSTIAYLAEVVFLCAKNSSICFPDISYTYSNLGNDKKRMG